jgi:hypothetical protein
LRRGDDAAGARGSSTLGRGLVEADARKRRGLPIADASN